METTDLLSQDPLAVLLFDNLLYMSPIPIGNLNEIEKLAMGTATLNNMM